jgi:glycosyltransferase involved in cell wall biosynthesis
VILCHHLYFLAALVRELYPGIPVYGQCHGSDLRQFLKNPWQHEWILSQISKLDGVFALHEEQKKQICFLFGIPQEKVHVMGTGYNSDVFFVNETIRQARQSEKIRLIFAGKISEKKGVMSLLRAMHYVRQPEIYELAFAGGYGNEEEYAEIQRLAEEAPCDVTFLGKLSHAQLAEEMNASDVFVLPSFYEGLPLVLIEALACGLQAICTDLTGIRPWMNRVVPNHGVCFVRPPEMENEDEALPESLPEFERRLAAAIDTIGFMPAADLNQVRQVSWDVLCGKMVNLWNNL